LLMSSLSASAEPPVPVDEIGGLVQVAKVADNDACSSLGQADGDRLADAAGSSRDQCDPSGGGLICRRSGPFVRLSNRGCSS
jgi:hypothetical protein